MEFMLGFHCRLRRLGRAWEDEEERIPLRVHLLPVPAGKNLPQDAVVLGQQAGVLLAQALEQVC